MGIRATIHKVKTEYEAGEQYTRLKLDAKHGN